MVYGIGMVNGSIQDNAHYEVVCISVREGQDPNDKTRAFLTRAPIFFICRFRVTQSAQLVK